MSPLDSALGELESQISKFNHGTKAQPKEGTQEWFMLRALSLGRSYLRRCVQLELHRDSPAAERFQRACAGHFKTVEIPPPAEVEREKLPDGTFPTGVI